MADESPVHAVKSDLGRRLITTIFLLPVIWVIYQGGTFALALVFAFGLIMAAEAVLVTGRALAVPLSLAQILLCLAPAISLVFSGDHTSMLLLLVLSVLFCLGTSRSLPYTLMIAGITASIIALAGIIGHPDGGSWLLLMIAVVIGADSAAYFVGRAVGGPKLAR